VLLDTTEEWKIVNSTSPGTTGKNIDHPLHIHINPFQVTELFDPNEKIPDPATGRPGRPPNRQRPRCRITEEGRRQMRNFGSIVVSAVVIGTWMASPAGAEEITLDAGPDLKWITAAAPGGNPTIPLAPGDVLVIRQSDPNLIHGFVFDDANVNIPLCGAAPTAGATFCLISAYGAKITGLGTPPHGEIMRLKVLQAIPADMGFHCTQHFGLMKGTVKSAP